MKMPLGFFCSGLSLWTWLLLFSLAIPSLGRSGTKFSSVRNNHTLTLQIFLRGDIQELSRQIDEDPESIHRADAYGNLPLSYAVKAGSLEAVSLLLNRGSAIDPVDRRGNTPLLLAVLDNNQPIIELLIDRGADIQLTRRDGTTPLGVALAQQQLGTAILLIDRGAPLTGFTQNSFTPTLWAAYYGSLELMRAIEQSPRFSPWVINQPDMRGTTPLMVAAKKGFAPLVQDLLRLGAEIDSRNERGETALSLAAQKGHRTIVQDIIQAGVGHAPRSRELVALIEKKYFKFANLLLAPELFEKQIASIETLEQVRGKKKLLRHLLTQTYEGLEHTKNLELFIIYLIKPEVLKILAQSIDSPAFEGKSFQCVQPNRCTRCISCSETLGHLEEPMLGVCPGGNTECQNQLCGPCAQVFLDCLLTSKGDDGGRLPDRCQTCKRRINAAFFEHFRCDSDQVLALRVQQLEEDANQVEGFLWCRGSDCPYGKRFTPGEWRYIQSCPVCGFQGCLTCLIPHDQGFDSQGNCTRTAENILNQDYIELLIKRGRKEPLKLDHRTRENYEKLDQTAPPGTPCPHCEEVLGENHRVKDHRYDGLFRQCPYCDQLIEKYGGCDHMTCRSPLCRRRRRGRTEFSWENAKYPPGTIPTQK